MKNPYQVFHSSCVQVGTCVRVVLVEPENPHNVGAVARAMRNTGLGDSLYVVGRPGITAEPNAERMAKHAKPILQNAQHFHSLDELVRSTKQRERALFAASTARIGSAGRPHPIRVRDASVRLVEKIRHRALDEVFLVFGCESDGLRNEHIDLCDWVVTIPSSNAYRSLNLAQAVLIFCYEISVANLEEWQPRDNPKPTQRQKLIQHALQIAEDVGFILPGDPYKMRPRLEEIFSKVLPNHLPEASTLHGLMDQVRRSVQRGEADYRGRYRVRVEENSSPLAPGQNG